MLRAILADTRQSFWMPERASTMARGTDGLFDFILYLSVFFFAVITIGTIVFVLKYRHRKGVTVANTGAGHSTALELTWTIIPTILVLIIYYYGFRQFLNQAIEPPGAYEITATGAMWNWSFTYPNGHIDSELHVPGGIPVRVVLKSQDVIHSLFIPSFRMKKDVVPGRYNRMWFEAIKKEGLQPDVYDVYCASYCGTNHSTMLTKAVVHEQHEFDHWLEDASTPFEKMNLIELGQKLYTQRGCSTCHSVDGGGGMTGPTWKDLYGAQVPCVGGGNYLADDAYISESIEYPANKIVMGFQNVMPSFRGQLKDYEIAGLTAYMKSISVNFKGDLAPLKEIMHKPGAKTGPVTKPATMPATVTFAH